MFKIIDYKKVDITEDEYDYYQQIVKEYSKEEFRDMFDTDEDGCINLVKPPLKKSIPWVVIFFLQNLMLNQRIRRMEKQITELINDR